MSLGLLKLDDNLNDYWIRSPRPHNFEMTLRIPLTGHVTDYASRDIARVNYILWIDKHNQDRAVGIRTHSPVRNTTRLQRLANQD